MKKEVLLGLGCYPVAQTKTQARGGVARNRKKKVGFHQGVPLTEGKP